MKLDFEHIFIFDGAMGTMLQKGGLSPGDNPSLCSVTHPELVTEVHYRYIQAGAMAATMNTFVCNDLKLEGTGITVEQLTRASADCARSAMERAGKAVLLVYDMGPTGALLKPMGPMEFDEAVALFAHQAAAAKDAGVDAILIETMSSLLEMKAAVLAVKENTDLPVLCTMTVEEDGRTFTGCCIESMVEVLEGLGVSALGFNCSVGPQQMKAFVERMAHLTNLPIMVQPNAGLPKSVDGQTVYDIDAGAFASAMAEIVDAGAAIVGGCCGTDEQFIRALSGAVGNKAPEKRSVSRPPAVCTATRWVTLDQVRAVGERINPTGKKLFQQALRQGDMDYIVNQALEQVASGAEILDVNVGLPDIDEPDMMQKVMQAISEVADVPLMFDSSNPRAIEAALRRFEGKAIINSVNGEKKSMDSVLPLAKKYGAAVVGLCMDEQGIPKTRQARIGIAERIIEEARTYGIDKKDIIIDCLTLTVSAESDQAVETLAAVRHMREKIGVATTLGVSNISFGLPSRETLNKTFLAMALEAGLTLPIINPSAMMDMVSAYRVLANRDENAGQYIGRFAGARKSRAEDKPAAALSLADVIASGWTSSAADAAKAALAENPAMDVVEKIIIPSLDEVGRRFEKGEIFLPQLMQSAQTVQRAFEVLKAALLKEGMDVPQKGTVILATVQGDVHDIGKNIVRVVLENYGFNVIDLGRDVPPEAIVEAAQRHGAKLVGLSALMTTTVPSMQETIARLKAADPDIVTMVGGAVLTEAYAQSIGAGFYGRDAAQAAAIAQRVYAG